MGGLAWIAGQSLRVNADNPFSKDLVVFFPAWISP